MQRFSPEREHRLIGFSAEAQQQSRETGTPLTEFPEAAKEAKTLMETTAASTKPGFPKGANVREQFDNASAALTGKDSAEARSALDAMNACHQAIVKAQADWKKGNTNVDAYQKPWKELYEALKDAQKILMRGEQNKANATEAKERSDAESVRQTKEAAVLDHAKGTVSSYMKQNSLFNGFNPTQISGKQLDAYNALVNVTKQWETGKLVDTSSYNAAWQDMFAAMKPPKAEPKKPDTKKPDAGKPDTPKDKPTDKAEPKEQKEKQAEVALPDYNTSLEFVQARKRVLASYPSWGKWESIGNLKIINAGGYLFGADAKGANYYRLNDRYEWEPSTKQAYQEAHNSFPSKSTQLMTKEEFKEWNEKIGTMHTYPDALPRYPERDRYMADPAIQEALSLLTKTVKGMDRNRIMKIMSYPFSERFAGDHDRNASFEGISVPMLLDHLDSILLAEVKSCLIGINEDASGNRNFRRLNDRDNGALRRYRHFSDMDDFVPKNWKDLSRLDRLAYIYDHADSIRGSVDMPNLKTYIDWRKTNDTAR